MMKSSSRLGIKTARLCLVLLLVAVSACGGGGGSSGGGGGKFGLINIEVDHTNPAIQTSQLYFNGDSGTFSCEVTSPMSEPGVFSCSSAEYFESTNEIIANVTIEGVAGEMYIELFNSPQLFVDIYETGGPGYWSGGGKFVEPQLFARTHMTYLGIQSSVFVFINPEPGHSTATLSGTGLASGVPLWDNNYVDEYWSYSQFSLTDDIPQTTGAFVIYNTNNGTDTPTDQRVQAGTYTVSMAGGQSYSVTYDKLDAISLFPASVLPPTRADITFTDSVTMDQAVTNADFANALIVSDGPYAISWVSEVASVSNSRWQIIFDQVDGSGEPVRHLQVRTPRMSTVGDLSYNSMTNTWTWAPLVQQATIEPGTVVRVRIRITNAANTSRAHAQEFYITRL